MERIDSLPLFETEGPKHECGDFGIYAPKEDVARLSFWGMCNLQHRGQESAGIATLSEYGITVQKKMGLLREGFTEEDIKSLQGFAAIGHTRYSNTGGSNLANAQPAVYENIAIAENGNLINPLPLRKELVKRGIYPSITDDISCSSDGEIIAQTIASSEGANIIEKIQEASKKFIGAFSLTVLAEDSLIALKDPHGIWPLCLGKLNGSGYVVASESAALDIIQAEYIREIEPGEIIQINEHGVKSYQLPQEARQAECSFDLTYFRAPDSRISPDRYVYQFREELGRQLARDFPTKSDIIIGEKDSGTFLAHGFAQESGIPFNEGSIKNPYSKRVYIDPDRRIRGELTKLKHRFLKPEIIGRSVTVVTDSIVEGPTSTGIINSLREAGAKEIHYRVGFPPIKYACHFGIDMASELMAAGRDVEEIRQKIGANSLAYLSEASFEKVLERSLKTFCTGCFTGEFPIPVPQQRDKYELENQITEVGVR